MALHVLDARDQEHLEVDVLMTLNHLFILGREFLLVLEQQVLDGRKELLRILAHVLGVIRAIPDRAFVYEEVQAPEKRPFVVLSVSDTLTEQLEALLELLANGLALIGEKACKDQFCRVCDHNRRSLLDRLAILDDLCWLAENHWICFLCPAKECSLYAWTRNNRNNPKVHGRLGDLSIFTGVVLVTRDNVRHNRKQLLLQLGEVKALKDIIRHSELPNLLDNQLEHRRVEK